MRSYIPYNSSLLFFLLLVLSSSNMKGQSFAWAQGFVASNDPAPSVSLGHFVVDNTNSICVLGRFQGTVDVDQGPNVTSITSVGVLNWFVLKESSAGGFQWVKHLTGPLNPNGNLYLADICQDAAGNYYIGGTFRDSVDFDPGKATYYMSAPLQYSHAFILKLDYSGNFVWAKEIGGGASSSAVVQALKIDSTGKLCIVGLFSGTIDGDPNSGIMLLTCPAPGATLVEKLDTAGNLIFAKQIDGASALGVTLDDTANFYMCGQFTSTVDFDPGPGVFNLTALPSSYPPFTPLSSFITKLDPLGNFQWAKQVRVSGPIDVSVDRFNNILLTGWFNEAVDFDPGPGVYTLVGQLPSNGRSLFTLRLRNNGDFSWVKASGSATTVVGVTIDGRGVIADSLGNVYTAADLYFPLDMDPGPGIYNVAAGCVVQKLDSAGNFMWAGSWQGRNSFRIALDHNNSIYTTGTFLSSGDFDPGPTVFTLSGNNGGFIEKLFQCDAPPLTPAVIISGQSSANIGQLVTLTAALTNSGNPYALTWKNHGTIITTTNVPTVTYTKGPGVDTITAELVPLSYGCWNPPVTNVHIVSDMTGISETLKAAGIEVYPNPFSSLITVKGLKRNDNLTLLDITGRTIYTWQATKETEAFKAEGLAAGQYILKIMYEKGAVRVNVPVVKQ